MRKFPQLSIVFAAIVILLLTVGCAGKYGSTMKTTFGYWDTNLFGVAQTTDPGGVEGDKVNFGDSDYADFDLNQGNPRIGLELGTTTRMRANVWTVSYDGQNDSPDEFTVFGTTFLANESVDGTMAFTGVELAGEFSFITLDELVDQASFRAFAGFGLKYIGIGAQIESISQQIDENVPFGAPFIVLGAEVNFLDYFAGGLTIDFGSFDFKFADWDIDGEYRSYKLFAGAYYPLGEDGKTGPRIGGEIGYLSNALGMTVDGLAEDPSDDVDKFEAKLGFRGIFVQGVLMF